MSLGIHCVISPPWMFLALLWCVRHWLPLSLQEVLSHLTFLSPADFPYFCNCNTLLVILNDSSLLFQYFLCAAGHLCLAFPLTVDVPSAPQCHLWSWAALPSPALSARIPWGWSEWASLDSSSLVPPALLHLVLSRLLHPKSGVVIPLWCVRPKPEPYTEPSLAQSHLNTDFCAHSFSCALTNPLSHRACSELSTKIAFALSSISFTYLLASLLFPLRTQLISSPCLSVSPAGLICAMPVWELSDQHSCAFPSDAPFGMPEI